MISLFAIQACSKEGEQGPAGKDGVSGIKMFLFSNDASPLNEQIEVTQSFVDSSISLVYYQDAVLPGTWYQAPGFGNGSNYAARYFLQPSVDFPTTRQKFFMEVVAPDGNDYNTIVTFLKVKLVFIPAVEVGKKEPVDYSDYKAIMKYYGLPE